MGNALELGGRLAHFGGGGVGQLSEGQALVDPETLDLDGRAVVNKMGPSSICGEASMGMLKVVIGTMCRSSAFKGVN